MLTHTQLSCRTRYTREGIRDMRNRKPYRNKALKAEARTNIIRVNGRWLSSAPVLFH